MKNFWRNFYKNFEFFFKFSRKAADRNLERFSKEIFVRTSGGVFGRTPFETFGGDHRGAYPRSSGESFLKILQFSEQLSLTNSYVHGGIWKKKLSKQLLDKLKEFLVELSDELQQDF